MWKIGFKKFLLLGGLFASNLTYASFYGMEMDVKNSKNIRENGYGYARKSAYEPSRYFQNFEIYGENGDISFGEEGDYKYKAKGITGGTFGRVWREWILGLGYGYVESEVESSEYSKKNLESLGGNLYLTRRSDFWSFTLSGGYTEGKNKVNYFGDKYNYKSEIYSFGLELNSRYEHRKNYNVYPYLGFDYSWEKEKILNGKKKESPLGKVGIIVEERHGDWLYSLDLAWFHDFGEKDENKEKPGIGKFKYGVEKEVGKSTVWGIYYGGTLIKDEYLHQYGITIRYNL
ncbi:MAG: autotransporter domain-containing protein [Fusobacteriaceae bacterium]